MSSYYINAGRTIEESPMREGSLYLYDKYVLLFFRPLFSFDQSQAFFFPNTKTRTFVLPSDAFFLLDTRERYTEKVGMIFSPTRHQSRKTGFVTTKRSVWNTSQFETQGENRRSNHRKVTCSRDRKIGNHPKVTLKKNTRSEGERMRRCECEHIFASLLSRKWKR